MARRTQNGIDINAEITRRGDAILASDRSAKAVFDIMRGCPVLVFQTMDRADNYYPVPEWHGALRRARNTPGFFKALNAGRK